LKTRDRVATLVCVTYFQNESNLELADLVAFACLYLHDKQVIPRYVYPTTLV